MLMRNSYKHENSRQRVKDGYMTFWIKEKNWGYGNLDFKSENG